MLRMSSDEEFDPIAHRKLLEAISDPGSLKKKKIKKAKPQKVDATSLLSHLNVKRRSTHVAKKSLGVTSLEDGESEEEPDDETKKKKRKTEGETEGQTKKKKKLKPKSKTLVPVRDLEANKKIEAAIGFGDLKGEMGRTWNTLVETSRIPHRGPKTRRNIQQRRVGSSASDGPESGQGQIATNPTNAGTRQPTGSQAQISEKDQIQELSSNPPPRKKRKQLLKEFEELMARDPAAAQEKLAEIENQRIIERGELKHRAKNRFQKEMANFASRNPEVKKMIEDHIRLGRELKAKVQEDSDSESEESSDEKSKSKSVNDILQEAAMEAEDETGPKSEIGKKLLDAFLSDPSNEKAKISLAELRAQKRRQAQERSFTAKNVSEPLFEVDQDWEVEKNEEDLKSTKKGKKNKKKAKKEPEVAPTSEEDLKAAEREAKIKAALKKAGVEDEDEKREKMIDPSKFLELTTSDVAKVSSDFVEKMDEFDEETANVISEAFKDDDVIGDFEIVKDEVQQKEKPKDVDLTLLGWGSWVGPGTTENKRRKKFVIKARKKKRKDGKMRGVIIRENRADMGIGKVQPRSLPPWASIGIRPMSDDLCKRPVVVEAGRAILPINKKDLLGNF
ncbi:unnamed protein product [Caenorhabditis auriculariae]|uniref:Uncharacterized protein n=1 Tax=Caenorhabditis auriculariae TaxID=2777116 RepID=A0A8S1HPR8_9PELO|nr:unnamed protein product [Caenorhabditis auriculariae]